VLLSVLVVHGLVISFTVSCGQRLTASDVRERLDDPSYMDIALGPVKTEVVNSKLDVEIKSFQGHQRRQE
jgi:hypothetical protein